MLCVWCKMGRHDLHLKTWCEEPGNKGKQFVCNCAQCPSRITERPKGSQGGPRYTSRQKYTSSTRREVVRLRQRGLSLRSISDRLGISYQAVAQHVIKHRQAVAQGRRVT